MNNKAGAEQSKTLAKYSPSKMALAGRSVGSSLNRNTSPGFFAAKLEKNIEAERKKEVVARTKIQDQIYKEHLSKNAQKETSPTNKKSA